MSANELKERYDGLYQYMAMSKNPAYMMMFGKVMNEMMDWMIANKPDMAEEMLMKLESIRWNNYLAPKEAEKIVAAMEPEAPWSREQWKQAMEQSGYALEKDPCYNRCALWTVMNMIMSDSSETISKYIDSDNMFGFVYEAAVDKLTDKDKNFNVREYFGL